MHAIARFMSVLVVAPVAGFTATSEPPPATPPDAAGLSELLAMVPASAFELGSPAQLYYVDMSLAWERLGVGADAAERQEHVGELAVVDTFTLAPQLFFQRLADFDAARAEIGFSTAEIERELAVLLPPDNLFIDVTTAPVGDVTAALAADPAWSSELTTVDSEFGPYYSWGTDGTELNLERVSPLRPLGQGGQLAVLGDTTATTIRTLGTAEMEAALATSAGAADSAATTAVIAPVLDTLAGETVLQLVATPTPPMLDPALLVLTPSEFEALLESGVFPEPYLGVAIAETTSAAGTSTEILLVHDDAESATANAALVTEAIATNVDLVTREPLSDLLPGAEVSADGRIVRVSLAEPGAFSTAFRMLQSRALFPAR